MPGHILWLDNDPAYLEPYVETLREEKYEVKVVMTVSEAETELQSQPFDLLILDVMIPTKGAAEEARYGPKDTDKGAKTGLLFYLRNKDRLQEVATRVLVMTVRLDEDIVKQFVRSGLSRDCFVTKFEVRDDAVFLNRVEALLGRAHD
ncbi:MAG: hypothetical protein ACJ74G_04565 [Blastocatellia bacterium]